MNLFRSEEHVRNWSDFKSDTDEGIIPLPDMAKLFSGNLFTRRLDPDYVSHIGEYFREMMEAFKDRGSFWQIPG